LFFFFGAVNPAKFAREIVVRMYTAQVNLLHLVCVGLCVLCMRWQRWKIAQKWKQFHYKKQREWTRK